MYLLVEELPSLVEVTLIFHLTCMLMCTMLLIGGAPHTTQA